MTKDGALAGPRVLEHLVDTVLSFEGDRHHALRLLRAVKHRFGAAGELGLFEMTGAGLEGVTDAGGLFLVDRRSDVPGSVVFPAMEGQRPLLVEIQALVVRSSTAEPAPVGHRVRLPAAWPCCWRCSNAGPALALGRLDVYVSVGRRGADRRPGRRSGRVPGAGVGRQRASRSATTLVVLGEVGLGGEIRQVAQTPRRLTEAARLGFRRALVPERRPDQGRSGTRSECRHWRRLWTACRAGGSTAPGAIDRCGGATQIAVAALRRSEPPSGVAGDRACVLQVGWLRCWNVPRAAMIEALGAIAPGRPLREGLDRILQANMGALIVVGDGPEVLGICSGGLLARRRVQPAAPVGAGQDGRGHHPGRRRQPHRPGQRPSGARTPTSPPTETGTRHRTAERVARSIDVPVISVSEDMSVITALPGRRQARPGLGGPPARAGPTRPCRPWSVTATGSTP